MFHRLVLSDATTLVTLVAFLTATTIFVTVVWGALRMPASRIRHFENLPFADKDAPHHDEPRA